jgi:hypothetical protein
VAPIITAPERASFRRGDPGWPGPPEPPGPEAVPGLGRAVRDALAIYYYPGMWDWDRGVRLPLVSQELDRAVTRLGADGAAAEQARRDGRALLTRYAEWAPGVDRFAPVLVETDFDVPLPDLQRPGSGLVTADGAAVRYRDRVHLLAVDEHDNYWIVYHRLAGGDWAPAAELAADEAALAACWAWEQFYLGMTITGTIVNELRAGADFEKVTRRRWRWFRRGAAPPAGPVVRQHEPSGGGRSLSQRQRQSARAAAPARAAAVEQVSGPGFRRTWLRRNPDEIAAAGQRLAADAAAMIASGFRHGEGG